MSALVVMKAVLRMNTCQALCVACPFLSQLSSRRVEPERLRAAGNVSFTEGNACFELRHFLDTTEETSVAVYAGNIVTDLAYHIRPGTYQTKN